MSETAGINVKFTGDSSGVVTESKAGERAVRDFDKSVDKASDTQKKFKRSSDAAAKSQERLRKAHDVSARAARAAAIAIAAATAAYAAFISRGLKAADSLAKTSDKLGIASEDLATLRLAALQTGVTLQTFDTGLQRLARRAGEASLGTGEAAKSFQALGFSTKELADLDPFGLFEKTAEGVTKLSSSNQQLAITSKLVDTEGVALVNTFRLGAAGLADMEQKAQLLGLRLSRDILNGVERANDATNLLTQGLSGLSQQLAARSAPFIEAIAKAAIDAVEAFGGMGKVADAVFAQIIRAAGFVADAFNGLKVVWLGVRAAFQTAGLGILAIVGSLDVAFVALGNKIIDLINLMTGSLNEAITSMVIKIRDFAQKVAASGFLPKELEQRAAAIARTTNDIAAALIKTRNASKITRLQVSDDLLNINKQAAALAKTYTDEFLAALAEPPPSEGFEAWAAEIRLLWEENNQAFLDQQEDMRAAATVVTEDIADAMGNAAAASATAWEKFGDSTREAFVQTFARAEGDVKDFVRRIEQSLKEAALRGAFDITIGAVFRGAGPFAGLIGGAGGGLGGLAGGGVAGAAGAGGLLAGAGGLASLFGTSGLTDTLGNIAGNIFGFGSGTTGSILNALGGRLGTNVLDQLGGNVLGGLAGGFVGTSLGEALFGKTANSSLGATAGGLIGSFFGGPLGSGIGAGIGGLFDAAFGGDDFKRSNTGFLTGSGVREGARGNRFGQVVTGASGLQFQTFTRRGDSEQSDALLDVAVQLDSVLTTLAEAAGATVDLANASLAGTAADTIRRPGSFFGAVNANSAEEAADRFVVAWLDEVNDQLPERVRRILGGVQQTAEELVKAFEAGLVLDELLDLNVVRDTSAAIDRLIEDQRTLLDVYDDSIENTLELASSLDNTADSYADLANALTEQRTLATQLTVAYREASIASDDLLGSTIQRIKESVLTEEELYASRRREIAELTSDLNTAIDPTRIRDLVTQIDRLANDAFNLLDEDQRQTLAGGFVTTLTDVNDLAQQRIDLGLGAISSREDAVTNALQLELAQPAAVMNDSANIFLNAANTFAAGLANPGVLTINIPGVGTTQIDLGALLAGQDQTGEVNA